jgi:hypothetical protein
MNKTTFKKSSSQNEFLSPSCIALSFDGFGAISWQSIFFRLLYSSHIFFGLGAPGETWVVEVCIWCIKISIVLVLHLQVIDLILKNESV